MRSNNRNNAAMSKDEYICRALGIYANNNNAANANQKRMRDRVRSSFNSVYGGEENFMNAKGDGKKKIGKWFKEGKKAIKKAAEKVSDAAKDVGKIAAKAALFVPRQAARGLIALNFRGFATKMNNLKPEALDTLKKNWDKVGGDINGLEDAIKSGKKKKPLACGKKCKSNSKGQSASFEGDGYYGVTGVEDTLALVATGLSLVTGVVGGILEKKNMKDKAEFDRINAELQDEEKKENNVPPTADDKAQADALKKMALEADARTQIQNNPNLTEDEKIVAINELNKVLSDPKDEGVGNNKNILFVVGGLAVVGLAYYFFTKSKKAS